MIVDLICLRRYAVLEVCLCLSGVYTKLLTFFSACSIFKITQLPSLPHRIPSFTSVPDHHSNKVLLLIIYRNDKKYFMFVYNNKPRHLYVLNRAIIIISLLWYMVILKSKSSSVIINKTKSLYRNLSTILKMGWKDNHMRFVNAWKLTFRPIFLMVANARHVKRRNNGSKYYSANRA